MKEVLPVAAPTLGLTVRSWDVRAAEDFEKVFAALNKQRPDGLYVAGGALMAANRKRIADFALKTRLPSTMGDIEFVEGGWRAHVLRGGSGAQIPSRSLLRGQNPEGAKPADLPVDQPTKFEFVINLKTAKQIGLTIPPNVLVRADRVIK